MLKALINTFSPQINQFSHIITTNKMAFKIINILLFASTVVFLSESTQYNVYRIIKNNKLLCNQQLKVNVISFLLRTVHILAARRTMIEMLR